MKEQILTLILVYAVLCYLAAKYKTVWLPAIKRKIRIKKIRKAYQPDRLELSDMEVYVGHRTGNVLLFDPEVDLCMCLKNSFIDM